MPRFALILALTFALAACASDPGSGPDSGSPAPATSSKQAGDKAKPAPSDEPKTKSGGPLKIVADKRTGRFYASDSPAAAKIPADQREEFENPYSALDRGYFPDADSDPMSRWK